MSFRTVFTCDKCGSEGFMTQSYSIRVHDNNASDPNGRAFGAATRNPDEFTGDLCLDCWIEVKKVLFKKPIPEGEVFERIQTLPVPKEATT